MKQTVVILILQLFMVVSVSAQGQQKFSPEKFDADMEKFVTEQAKLTQQEADKFFPLFREMHQKQRAVYHKIRQATKQQPADDNFYHTVPPVLIPLLSSSIIHPFPLPSEPRTRLKHRRKAGEIP